MKNRLAGKYAVDEATGCWNWTASRLLSGYGQATRLDASERWRRGLSTQEGAHRTSYKMHKGPIPEGLDVRHLCNNKLCVNPDHLAVGTRRENMADYRLVAVPRTRDGWGRFAVESGDRARA